VILSVGRQQLAGVSAFRASERRNATQTVPFFSTTSKHVRTGMPATQLFSIAYLQLSTYPGGGAQLKPICQNNTSNGRQERLTHLE